MMMTMMNQPLVKIFILTKESFIIINTNNDNN